MLEHKITMQLIEDAHNGDETAKATLIKENYPLVKSIAKRFYGRLEFEDLLQLGAMGLVKAINNFDCSFDVQFSTYAVPMIVGEIKRFLRDDGAIKVSRAIKTLSYKIAKFIEEYKSEKQAEPSIDEIATALDIDPKEIVFAMDASQCIVSINQESENNSGELIERLIVGETNNDRSIDNLLVKKLIEELPEKEKKVIILRYFRDKTQTEVAKELGVSQVQVSRMENKILQFMRNEIEKP